MSGRVVGCVVWWMGRFGGELALTYMKIRLDFIALAAISISFSGCNSGCENEVVSEFLSPSGKMKAVVFERDCGATTGFNTQVSIVDADRHIPDEGGNAIILDERAPLSIRWISDDELSVSGWRKARIFTQEKSVNDVRIRYEN